MMKSALATMSVALLMALGLSADGQRDTGQVSPALATPAPAGLPLEAQTALVKQYCVRCHSDRGRAGGLTLDTFDAAHIDRNVAVAEKMIRKLRAGMMPPPSATRRPEQAVPAAAPRRRRRTARTG